MAKGELRAASPPRRLTTAVAWLPLSSASGDVSFVSQLIFRSCCSTLRHWQGLLHKCGEYSVWPKSLYRCRQMLTLTDLVYLRLYVNDDPIESFVHPTDVP